LIDLQSRPVETGVKPGSTRRIQCPSTKGYSVMTSKQILLAAAMAFIAVPASAANTSAGQKADKNAAVDQKKYCVSYENIVGSRVTRQECKTKAEWAKDRVDIDKMLKE
jgi:hypothetical protein